MYRLLYMSTATKDFSDIELEELLEKARKNNSQKNLTGLLIIKGRTFLQCLEGNEEDVMEIFTKIKSDDRHCDIIELLEEDIKEPLFPLWSMGYKNIKNLTDFKSEKLKDFSKEDELNLTNDEIIDIFKEFVEES